MCRKFFLQKNQIVLVTFYFALDQIYIARYAIKYTELKYSGTCLL